MLCYVKSIMVCYDIFWSGQYNLRPVYMKMGDPR